MVGFSTHSPASISKVGCVITSCVTIGNESITHTIEHVQNNMHIKQTNKK